MKISKWLWWLSPLSEISDEKLSKKAIGYVGICPIAYFFSAYFLATGTLEYVFMSDGEILYSGPPSEIIIGFGFFLAARNSEILREFMIRGGITSQKVKKSPPFSVLFRRIINAVLVLSVCGFVMRKLMYMLM